MRESISIWVWSREIAQYLQHGLRLKLKLTIVTFIRKSPGKKRLYSLTITESKPILPGIVFGDTLIMEIFISIFTGTFTGLTL